MGLEGHSRSRTHGEGLGWPGHRKGQQSCDPFAPWACVVGVTGKQQAQWMVLGSDR